MRLRDRSCLGPRTSDVTQRRDADIRIEQRSAIALLDRVPASVVVSETGSQDGLTSAVHSCIRGRTIISQLLLDIPESTFRRRGAITHGRCCSRNRLAYSRTQKSPWIQAYARAHQREFGHQTQTDRCRRDDAPQTNAPLKERDQMKSSQEWVGGGVLHWRMTRAQPWPENPSGAEILFGWSVGWHDSRRIVFSGGDGLASLIHHGGRECSAPQRHRKMKKAA
ncbi:hypothetical protein DAEQUDRAFT_164066 [Daedalea quercina L-15889]|uniref:Uncharacterized protein n=1 Tax=Daedalea quercina L-15889 TaxID=1314783 RepID=A0A165RH83_9APHY|nr:hypothetical protein DAEQUDRAFT_164066 [Daedalea quercina L-15889]